MNDEQWVRRTLDDAVAGIEPPDALDTIRSRTKVTPMTNRPWIFAAGGALLATAATITAFALVNNDDTPRDNGGPVTPPSTSPSDGSPTETPTTVQQVRVPVYYLGEVSFPNEQGGRQTSFRLYREWRDVNDSGSALETAAAALEAMFTRPADPDYATLWTPNVEVLGVAHEDGVITVDLTGPAEGLSVGSESAELTLQQLVYTVQGALAVAKEDGATDPVRITIDGAPVSELWGHVDVSEPVQRAKATGTQAPIWITEPTDGETVTMPVTVTGVAQVFEATVNWRVLQNGTEVASGFGMASEGAPAFADYSFDVEGLDPGEYVLEVFEASALDGSDTNVDTKSFTVE